MKINATQNRQLHTLLSQTQRMEVKAELVLSFTDGRSESTKELQNKEADALIKHLQQEQEKQCGPTRNSIIHHLCLLGFTTEQDRPDYTRINAFIQQIGSNNPSKLKLNYLPYKQLLKVCTQVKAMHAHEVQRWIKQIPK